MKIRSLLPSKRSAVVLFIAVNILVGAYHHHKYLPDGMSFRGGLRAVEQVNFLADYTYVSHADLKNTGERVFEHEIFDAALKQISQAQRFILLDMFLFNDFKGKLSDIQRPLTREVSDALIQQKKRFPDLHIVVITDPINTAYGSVMPASLQRLEDAGTQLVFTDLDSLRDSNWLYSGFWRVLAQPWGSSEPGDETWLPSAMGDFKMTARSWARMLNFKANHRKALITDKDDEWWAMVMSANAHDASSGHSNVALQFNGAAVADLLETERFVMRLSGADISKLPEIDVPAQGVVAADIAGNTTISPDGAIATETKWPSKIEVVTEKKIKSNAAKMLKAANEKTTIDMAMFYLAERDLLHLLKQAYRRGAKVRVLLDPNKDAFGRTKGGLPNRQVAAELALEGIPVRWCNTQGEQCHAKFLMVHGDGQPTRMLLGSANFTRRNLDNFNLELSVYLRGEEGALEALQDARRYFERVWGNQAGEQHSVAYEVYKNHSYLKYGWYRFLEMTGIDTF